MDQSEKEIETKRYRDVKDHQHLVLSKEKEGEWKREFSFIQMADTQFGLMAAAKIAQEHLGKLPVPRDLQPQMSLEESYQQELEMTERTVAIINSMNPPPTFVIVCGDLVNAFPSQPEEQEKQVKDYKRLFSKLKEEIPLVCLCGNHDVGDRPTPQTIELYKSRFGDDYFTFWISGSKFIVINSQFYKDNTDSVELSKEHDEWLSEELKKNEVEKPTHCIVMSHIAPYIEKENEASGYFNFDQETRKKLLDKMKKGKVSKWFCGHFHRNAGGYTEDGSLECVITTAVGCTLTSNPKGDLLGLTGMGGAQVDDNFSGFRIVNVTKEDVKHTFYNIREAEALFVQRGHPKL